jgi:hypothetical protein
LEELGDIEEVELAVFVEVGGGAGVGWFGEHLHGVTQESAVITGYWVPLNPWSFQIVNRSVVDRCGIGAPVGSVVRERIYYGLNAGVALPIYKL